MAKCKNCKHRGGLNHVCDECINHEMFEKKVVTNADRIRSMTDEELAEFLYKFNDIDEKVKFYTNKKVCIDLLDKGDTLPNGWCKECLLAWLKSEMRCE